MNAIKTKWNGKRMNERTKKNGAILSRMLYLLVMWLINRAAHVIELIYVSFVCCFSAIYFECQKIILRFSVELYVNVQFLWFWRRALSAIALHRYMCHPSECVCVCLFHFFLVGPEANEKRAKKYETSKAIKLNETCFFTNFISCSVVFFFSWKCVTKLERKREKKTHKTLWKILRFGAVFWCHSSVVFMCVVSLAMTHVFHTKESGSWEHDHFSGILCFVCADFGLRWTGQLKAPLNRVEVALSHDSRALSVSQFQMISLSLYGSLREKSIL